MPRTKKGSPTLQGCCGLLSDLLAEVAYNRGVDLEIAKGRVGRKRAIHFWCVYRNRSVIDLTATQFWDCARVYVVSVDHRRYRGIEYQDEPSKMEEWYLANDYQAQQRIRHAFYHFT